MAYVPSPPPPGWVSRSCAALYQAWTWAPKRNQVFSESLISRDGPSTAKVGTGDVLPASGLDGAVSGAFGFSVDCADAAAAADIAITSAGHQLLPAFEILPMSSSSAVGLRRKIPLPRMRRAPCSPLCPAFATRPGKRFRRAEWLGRSP